MTDTQQATTGHTLLSRLAAHAVQKPADPAPVEEPLADHGPNSFSADFFTEYRIVRAELRSPEMRLSDHLNSTAGTVDMRPCDAIQSAGGFKVDLDGTHGTLTKSRILFVIPISEPPRPAGNANGAWKSTVTRSCWAGVGPYRLSGNIHTEAARDSTIALRQIDTQFIPLTDTTITFPDGTTRECSAIFINRAHLDLLTIKDRY
ncbi:MAG TPA: hypothetical protein VF898_12105 [Chloroflexota bacterium]